MSHYKRRSREWHAKAWHAGEANKGLGGETPNTLFFSGAGGFGRGAGGPGGCRRRAADRVEFAYRRRLGGRRRQLADLERK